MRRFASWTLEYALKVVGAFLLFLALKAIKGAIL